MKQKIKIALLGHGTVGQAFRRMILEHSHDLSRVIRERTGREVTLEIVGVLVHHPEKHGVLGETCFLEAQDLLRLDYDILIELIGGVEPATELMQQALKVGKDVVTANKQALFLAQGVLEKTAREHKAYLRYEGAVAGAVPILRSIQSLNSGRIDRLEGILNGSTNYILTKVAQGWTLPEAMAEAAAKGYLEADPSSDLQGYDAMYKLGILSYLITGRYPKQESMERIGLTALSEGDILEAQREGKKYKLLAQADFSSEIYSVKPVALPQQHFLYAVDGALNGIMLHHAWAGELTFIGAGAGGQETASAVIGDVLDIICARIKENYYD